MLVPVGVEPHDWEPTIKDVQQILLDNNYVKPGDVVINTGSMPLNEQGIANMVKISVI